MKKIALTIHKIDKNIDQGKLLYKKFVIRRNRDTEKEIINKIIKIMPNGIKKSIFNFKNRKLKNITKGKYYLLYIMALLLKIQKNLKTHIYITL